MIPVAHVTAWAVDRQWPTFEQVEQDLPEELVATKLRAVFQRDKGRVLDLWIALTEMNLEPSAIVAAFTPYRPTGYTAARAITNLREKLARPTFRGDLAPLVLGLPDGYDVDEAADLVITELLENIE